MPRAQLSVREKDAICYLSNKLGLQTRRIGRAFRVSSQTISRISRANGATKARRPSARTIERIRRIELLRRLVARRQRGAFSSRDARNLLIRHHNIVVGTTAVCRYLRALGLRPLVRPRTTIREPDAKVRLGFSRIHVRSDPARFVFSDEKIWTTNDATSRTEWVPRGELASRRVHQRYPQGRVQVWAAIGVNFRHLVIFPASRSTEDSPNCSFRLTQDDYRRFCLQGVVMNHLRNNPNLILQQDGASAHWGNRVVAYIERQGIGLLRDWPAHSPDLSPIETLWAIMSPRVAEIGPTTRDELVDAIRHVWAALDQNMINNLVLSFHARCRRVAANKGVQ